MKRLLVLLLIIPMLTLNVFAATSGSEKNAQQQNDIMEQQIEKSGAGDLYSNVPDNAKKSLDGLDIKNPDPQGLTSFTPAGIFKIILKNISDAAKRPLKSILIVVAVLLAYALLSTLKTSLGEKPLKKVFDLVCALCIAAVVLTPIAQCISETGKVIKDTGNFSAAFLPVFTSLVAASGHPASAVVYHALMLTISQVIIEIASTTFVPMVTIYLAFCVIGSVSPGINLKGLAGFAKTFVNWALGLCLTVFVGILTIQGLISNASDNVTIKTAKFMVGSFVPVIGSTISDAINTVVGCASLLKTAVGAYAIIVFVFAFLPPLIECLIWMLSIDLSVAVADILGVTGMSEMLKSIKDALSIMIALVLTVALAFVISTSVMLLVGMGN